ncbi:MULTISPECIES: Cu(I)-responsive transcriptional regulator [Rhodomicrobium]|uniref:Cu(I)-responsive transcriptional regulator n=1 Tax=Rhodomicrobium TaxID=1068 RepID=UPI000B4B7F8B|nr:MULTISPECIES: Cu(I)-responsive transcriptional regulator [Rhodomicrobium]
MNIGQVAQASGISAKMIRYYESIGLFPQAGRTLAGYRNYGAADVNRLCFIRRARDLGFSLDSIRELLKLWSDQDRHSADVRSLALAHMAELEARAAALGDMIKTLRSLLRACDGDQRPDCPIMDVLGAAPSPA